MAETRLKHTVNERLARLVTAAMERDGITTIELGDLSGLGRGVVGRIARGEIQRPAPEQANRLVPHLPITMAQFLEACGYNVGVRPADLLPKDLVERWPSLRPHDQDSIRALVLSLTEGRTQEQESAG